LLSEEFDPRLQRQLGNFPQAFSHLALVNSALDLRDGSGSTQRSQCSGEGAKA
jgi:GH15 family glucan-1,4-alpha-glucosidase